MKMTMQVIGHLGQNATAGEADGRKVLNFSVAHTVKYKDRQGEKQEKTTWVSCSFWNDNAAEKLLQYMKKGTLVSVEGIPSTRIYKDRDGNPQSAFDLNVKDCKLLAAAKENNAGQPNNQGGEDQQQPQEQTPPEGYIPGTDDDLPF